MGRTFERQSTVELGIVHERYNHITNLRLRTAYRFIYVTGATLGFVAYLYKEADPNRALNEEVATGIVFFVSAVLTAIGWAMTEYDAIARKVSSVVAARFLCLTRGGSSSLGEPDPSCFRFFDEELFFFLPVLVLTSALFTLSIFAGLQFAGAVDVDYITVCGCVLVTSFCFLGARWKNRFLTYTVAHWEPSGYRRAEEAGRIVV